MIPIKFSIVRSRKQHLMALTLKIFFTSGSKWRPFLKIVITRRKTFFFGGSISTSVTVIKRHLHTKFHAFNQKCTIFSHNRLTIDTNAYYKQLTVISKVIISIIIRVIDLQQFTRYLYTNQGKYSCLSLLNSGTKEIYCT